MEDHLNSNVDLDPSVPMSVYQVNTIMQKHTCLSDCLRYTCKRERGRTLLNYWPISISSKIFCNNSRENICFYSSGWSERQENGCNIRSLCLGAVSCDWLSVSRSANQKLLLAGQSEAAEWRLSLQELYQELETQRGLSRGNTRTGSRKAYASMDITRWGQSSGRKIWTSIRGT